MFLIIIQKFVKRRVAVASEEIEKVGGKIV